MGDLLLVALAAVAVAVAFTAEALATCGAYKICGIVAVAEGEESTASGALDLKLFVVAIAAITIVIVAITAVAIVFVEILFESAEILIKLLAVITELTELLRKIGNVGCKIVYNSNDLLKKLCFGLCFIDVKTLSKALEICCSFGKCHNITFSAIINRSDCGIPHG